jgi:histone H3/H4
LKIKNYLNQIIYPNTMARKTQIIPRAPVGRLIARAGAQRVSADAMNTLANILTDIAEEIGERAVKIAKHTGRKTVKAGDIKLAAK